MDRLLLSIGVPLETVLWSHEDHNSYKYAPIDEETRETLEELDQRQQKAYEVEDFGQLKTLSKDIRTLFEVGTQIL